VDLLGRLRLLASAASVLCSHWGPAYRISELATLHALFDTNGDHILGQAGYVRLFAFVALARLLRRWC
jgi:hypothetical protein